MLFPGKNTGRISGRTTFYHLHDIKGKCFTHTCHHPNETLQSFPPMLSVAVTRKKKRDHQMHTFHNKPLNTETLKPFNFPLHLTTQ